VRLARPSRTAGRVDCRARHPTSCSPTATSWWPTATIVCTTASATVRTGRDRAAYAGGVGSLARGELRVYKAGELVLQLVAAPPQPVAAAA
jgi:hypothetical protein